MLNNVSVQSSKIMEFIRLFIIFGKITVFTDKINMSEKLQILATIIFFSNIMQDICVDDIAICVGKIRFWLTKNKSSTIFFYFKRKENLSVINFIADKNIISSVIMILPGVQKTNDLGFH